jgi:hypothetical protein
MIQASDNCFSLSRHWVLRAFSFAAARAGNNMAAKMAIMAITTNNSINVKPVVLNFRFRSISKEPCTSFFSTVIILD